MREAIKGVLRGHQRQTGDREACLMREAIKGVLEACLMREAIKGDRTSAAPTSEARSLASTTASVFAPAIRAAAEVAPKTASDSVANACVE